MASHNRQLSNNSRSPFTAMVGVLSTGICTFLVLTQMAHPVIADPTEQSTAVDLASGRTAAIAVGNPAHKAVIQQTAALSVKDGAKVSIVNFAFMPAEITIAPGQRVTWTNDDGAPHGLEYHDATKGADLLLPGATFSRRFDQPGTYDYNCTVHPYMTGRVVVRAK